MGSFQAYAIGFSSLLLLLVILLIGTCGRQSHRESLHNLVVDTIEKGRLSTEPLPQSIPDIVVEKSVVRAKSMAKVSPEPSETEQSFRSPIRTA